MPQLRPVLDAIRISDGTTVMIKQIPKGRSDEVQIGRYLSSPELRDDEDNHSVPILDDFQDEEEPEVVFIVMPVLRPFDDPPFFAVREAVEIGRAHV